jgi:prepilin-type N-terminal cleavage/methylation domain-containing protein
MKDQRTRPATLRGSRGGFTLIELVAALAITVLIAGLVLGLVSSMLNHWNRSQGALTTASQARPVLDRLAQDLQGALYRDDGNVWFAATVQPVASVSGAWVNGTKPAADSLAPAAEDLAEARFGVAGTWLRFFTAAQGADARTNDPAAPVAVSYQIIRRAPVASGSSCHYLLYRAAVTPSDTFAAGYDLGAAIYNTGASSEGVAGNVTSPAILQVMADNVIDFGVRLYSRVPDPATGGTNLVRIFPADASDLEHRARSPATAGDPRDRFPAVADVLLRVLTEEGARQIAALEAGQITGDWWAIAQANSKVFTRRVLLRSGAL